METGEASKATEVRPESRSSPPARETSGDGTDFRGL